MSSTPEEVKARSSRVVEGPSGLRYVVRQIPLWKLVALMRGVPDLMEALRASRRGRREDQHAAVGAFLQDEEKAGPLAAGVIEAGLVSPAIGEDGLEVADIPWQDQPELLGAIMDLSGFNRAAAEALRPTSAGPGSSETSTPSAGDTGSDPRPSSPGTIGGEAIGEEAIAQLAPTDPGPSST